MSNRPRRLKAKPEEKTIGDLLDAVLGFVKEHESLAAPIVFVLAFGKSLAFVSLLLPATVILFGIGGLIGATGIAFWPIWLAATLGATLGDWLSYWLGYHYKYEIAGLWPLSRRPDLLPRGEAFFRRWGIAGIFFGRFFGPLRSAVPLVAGICAMHFGAVSNRKCRVCPCLGDGLCVRETFPAFLHENCRDVEQRVSQYIPGTWQHDRAWAPGRGSPWPSRPPR